MLSATLCTSYLYDVYMTTTTKTYPTTAHQAQGLKTHLILTQDRLKEAKKHLNDCDIIIQANMDEVYENSANWSFLDEAEDLKVRSTREVVAFEIGQLEILIDGIHDLINDLDNGQPC